MNTITSALATTKESTPLRIESFPSDGPTVRSSISFKGAGSAPLRSTLARSCASVKSKRPRMSPRPPVIGVSITGADSTTPSRTMASWRPTFALVISPNSLVPRASSTKSTTMPSVAAPWETNASVSTSPVMRVRRSTATGPARLERVGEVARLDVRFGYGDQARETVFHERLDLRTLVLVGEPQVDGPALPLDRGGADLLLAQRPLEVLHLSIDRVVDRLIDVDAVEEVGPALQIEAKPDRLAPGPERRRRPHEARHQEDEGGH